MNIYNKEHIRNKCLFFFSSAVVISFVFLSIFPHRVNAWIQKMPVALGNFHIPIIRMPQNINTNMNVNTNTNVQNNAGNTQSQTIENTVQNDNNNATNVTVENNNTLTLSSPSITPQAPIEVASVEPVTVAAPVIIRQLPRTGSPLSVFLLFALPPMGILLRKIAPVE